MKAGATATALKGISISESTSSVWRRRRRMMIRFHSGTTRVFHRERKRFSRVVCRKTGRQAGSGRRENVISIPDGLLRRVHHADVRRGS